MTIRFRRPPSGPTPEWWRRHGRTPATRHRDTLPPRPAEPPRRLGHDGIHLIISGTRPPSALDGTARGAVDAGAGTLTYPWHGLCHGARTGARLSRPGAALRPLPARVARGRAPAALRSAAPAGVVVRATWRGPGRGGDPRRGRRR